MGGYPRPGGCIPATTSCFGRFHDRPVVPQHHSATAPETGDEGADLPGMQKSDVYRIIQVTKQIPFF